MRARCSGVFLDEIGELPLELQPKLLRVLQEGELEPVGSSRTLKVDVRIVAATNRDLADCVKRGTFREDLFYRLNARQIGRALAPLSEVALAKLCAYPWPGNVRELQNVIERGVILSTRGVFDLERALPEAARAAPRAGSPADSARVRTVGELLELERANIERALSQSGGKVSGPKGAAALLDTHPSTLNSRMRSLGITRPTR